MSNERTHYDVLGIILTADGDTIKKAYRKVALENHPDKTLGLPEREREERSQLFKLASTAKMKS